MPKTDKELTAEIVNTFITSWNAKSTTTALKTTDLLDIIQSVYETVHNLPVDK